jgi:hypothetical protein
MYKSISGGIEVSMRREPVIGGLSSGILARLALGLGAITRFVVFVVVTSGRHSMLRVGC